MPDYLHLLASASVLFLLFAEVLFQQLSQFPFKLLGILEDNAVHAQQSSAFYVFCTVIGEDALFGLEVEPIEKAMVDLWLGFDNLLFGRDDLAIEQAEDRELGHCEMYLTAPVGQAIKFIAFCFQLGEEFSHARNFLGYELWVVLAEDTYLWFKLLVSGNEFVHDNIERALFTVQQLLYVFIIEYGSECQTSVCIGDVLAEKSLKVIIHKYLTEIEYNIFNHVDGILSYLFMPIA